MSSSLQPLNPSTVPTATSSAFRGVYAGKSVLVTGHTGFKGSWLCEWLLSLGAKVSGYSLPPPTQPALFDQLGLASRVSHHIGDVRDLAAFQQVLATEQPEILFHLAAQPLVRLSYSQPVETFATNVMGTVNVLEAVRLAEKPCVVVAITTDKCYENKEWVHSYREEDPMGGYDPYSASKGAAELVISAYRRSYFSAPDAIVKLASVRAGNVIGGGDWALDRIVPDCIRALQRGESIPVRNKIATRPWQHVLEPLSGYLWLGACLAGARSLPSLSVESLKGSTPSTVQLAPTFQPALCGAFNFGPALTSNRTVAELVQEILKHWPGQWDDKSDPKAVHEAKLLNLATDKAFHFLSWKPVWPFNETIEHTVSWYKAATGGGSAGSKVESLKGLDGGAEGLTVETLKGLETGTVQPLNPSIPPPSSIPQPVIQAITATQIKTYQTDAAAAGITWAL